MISLLCPSRGRPKAAIDLYKSFIDTQKFKLKVIFFWRFRKDSNPN